MINITTYLSQSLIPEDLALKDSNVIVVDVLRATSTITIALANGAREIIPAESVPVAARIAKGKLNSLLCGERGGKIIEGFNLGNSPLEYTSQVVKDKTLVFCTTNGTPAIVKTRFSKTSVIAGFINLSAVVDYIKKLNEDFIIICSGKLNNYCLEDAVYAGLLLNRLLSVSEKNRYVLNDAENTCLAVSEKYSLENNKPSSNKILDMMKSTEHGKFLIGLGFEEDLKICSAVDSYTLIPVFIDGSVKLQNIIETEKSRKQKMKKVNINTGEKKS